MRTSFKFLLIASMAVMLPMSILADDVADREAQYVTDVAAYFGDTTGTAVELAAMEIALEDLPACFVVAKAATTSPQSIGKLRAQGDTWSGILGSRNLQSSLFYFMIAAKFQSRIFSPLLEKFTSTPEADWSGIVLSDEDITNLANLRFISSHHDYSIFDVMAMRDKGKAFVRIDQQIGELKAELLKKEKMEKKAKQTEAAEAKSEGGE